MPERIRLSRARGWRMADGTVKVDRATIWGNPWRAGSPGVVRLPHGDRPADWGIEPLAGQNFDAAHAVQLYRLWLRGDPPLLPPVLNARGRAFYSDAFSTRRAAILDRLPELRARDLACWCPLGSPCHADVLLELANG